MSIDPVSLAITVALTGINMAMTASRHIEGPRVKDLSGTVADYGTPMPYFRGLRRLEAPCFFCEPIREVYQERKTKGGKITNYTYFGTFAVLIADHKISKVRRIWMDRHLVYDHSSASEQVFALADDYQLSLSTRFYYGSETQEPDPRMLATVEAERGAGTCPAYRGKSYVIFENLPLEKFGNRYPQVSIEASTVGSTLLMHEDIRQAPYIFSDNQVYLANYNGANASAVIDNTSRSSIHTLGSYTAAVIGGYSGMLPLAIGSDGTIWGTAEGGHATMAKAPDLGLDISLASSAGTWTAATAAEEEVTLMQVLDLPDGSQRVVWIPNEATFGNNHTIYTLNPASGGVVTHETFAGTGVAWSPQWFFQDENGDIWAVGVPETTSAITTAYLWRIVDTGTNPVGDFATITGLPSIPAGSPSGTQARPRGFVSERKFLLEWFGTNASDRYACDKIIKIDMLTLAAEAPHTMAAPYYSPTCNPVAYRAYTHERGQLDYARWDASDATAQTWYRIDCRTFDVFGTYTVAGDWGPPATTPFVHESYNNSIIGWSLNDPLDPDAPGNDPYVSWLNFDVSLGEICRDVAVMSGLDTTDVDFSDLRQKVEGYSWTQATGQQILAPLLDIYDSDIRPHGFILQGIKRAGVTGGTIAASEFVADAQRYQLTMSNDTDLPRRIFLNYADIEADQQPNAAIAQRSVLSVDSSREQSFDLTNLVMEKSVARQYADRQHRRTWFARASADLSLTRQQLALEPADVRTLTFDDETITMRLTKMTLTAKGAISTSWTEDDPTLALLSGSAGIGSGGRPVSTVFDPAPAVGYVMDLPLISDIHDQATPFVYLAAGAADARPFFGADVAHSDTGDTGTFAVGWSGVPSISGSVIGMMSDTLGDALPWVMDRGSAVSVVVDHGTLTSTTEDALLASDTLNLALIGDELVQFTTATLTTTNTYTLSGFIRGVRGTERFIGTHGASERFVLLGSATLIRAVGASEIGDTDSYIFTRVGATPSEAGAQSLAFAAAAHKPYSPVYGSATLSAGDWTITATRRTRIGAATVNGQDVPLGEASESWQADIMDGSTVKRTISGSSLPLTYTAAQQTTDWGSGQTTLTVRLYQVDPTLSLRGYPLEIIG